MRDMRGVGYGYAFGYAGADALGYVESPRYTLLSGFLSDQSVLRQENTLDANKLIQGVDFVKN